MKNFQEIEEIQEKLNNLVVRENALLFEGEILELSEKLDKLITEYYGDDK